MESRKLNRVVSTGIGIGLGLALAGLGLGIIWPGLGMIGVLAVVCVPVLAVLVASVSMFITGRGKYGALGLLLLSFLGLSALLEILVLHPGR